MVVKLVVIRFLSYIYTVFTTTLLIKITLFLCVQGFHIKQKMPRSTGIQLGESINFNVSKTYQHDKFTKLS